MTPDSKRSGAKMKFKSVHVSNLVGKISAPRFQGGDFPPDSKRQRLQRIRGRFESCGKDFCAQVSRRRFPTGFKATWITENPVDVSNLVGKISAPRFQGGGFPPDSKRHGLQRILWTFRILWERFLRPGFKAEVSHRIQSDRDYSESCGRFESCGKLLAPRSRGENFPPDSKRHGLQRILWTFRILWERFLRPGFKAEVSHRIQSDRDYRESCGRFESCGKDFCAPVSRRRFPTGFKATWITENPVDVSNLVVKISA